MANKEKLETCCVCSQKWIVRDLNFHDLCWRCFRHYNSLKMNGRWSKNPSEDEKFFGLTGFAFQTLEARERLKKIIDRDKDWQKLKQPCPLCSSSDAVGVEEDGTGICFCCGEVMPNYE